MPTRPVVAAFLAALTLALPSAAQDAGADPPAGFQKTTWGMSRAEVQAIYPGGKESGADYYIRTPVAETDAMVIFSFAGDRLAHVSVGFHEQPTNKNRFVEIHATFKDLLSKKYGKPSRDDRLWSNTLFQSKPDKIGMAIVAGHARLLASWETPDSKITLRTMGEKYKGAVFINYASTALSADWKAQRDAAKVSEL